MAEASYHGTSDAARAALGPYGPLDAFLTEHRLCRPGLDEPDMRGVVVALSCGCGARVAVRLRPARG